MDTDCTHPHPDLCGCEPMEESPRVIASFEVELTRAGLLLWMYYGREQLTGTVIEGSAFTEKGAMRKLIKEIRSLGHRPQI